MVPDLLTCSTSFQTTCVSLYAKNKCLDFLAVMCKLLPMKTISVPIGEGRTDLCQLIKKVEAGAVVILTAYGKPKAVLSAYREQGTPWRVEKPDNPTRYGDLETPVMEPWK